MRGFIKEKIDMAVEKLFELSIVQSEKLNGFKIKPIFGFDVTEAYLCDLMENKLQKLGVKDNAIKIPVSAFEIVTVMVK